MNKDPKRPYGDGFKIVEGENDGGRPCRDCTVTGKCFCLGEKGNRVSRVSSFSRIELVQVG